MTGAIARASKPWARLEAACTAHLEALHAAKEYGSVIATEFPHRHSKKLRTRMIAERNGYEDIFREVIDALPLGPGVSREYLRLAVIGTMAWSLVWYSPGEDGVDKIAKQIVNLFRAAKDS